MRISTTKLAILVGLVGAFALAASASAASADTLSCTGNTGTVKLSPGLTETGHVQNITVKGTLSGCSGEGTEVTEGTYVAHLKTTEAVTCAALKSAGAPAEGTIVLQWPGANGTSKGTLSMPLAEPATTLSGTVAEEEGELFAADTISGTVTQSYTGGANCGLAPQGHGHKKAKKVNKGALSGNLAIS